MRIKINPVLIFEAQKAVTHTSEWNTNEFQQCKRYNHKQKRNELSFRQTGKIVPQNIAEQNQSSLSFSITSSARNRRITLQYSIFFSQHSFILFRFQWILFLFAIILDYYVCSWNLAFHIKYGTIIKTSLMSLLAAGYILFFIWALFHYLSSVLGTYTGQLDSFSSPALLKWRREYYPWKRTAACKSHSDGFSVS